VAAVYTGHESGIDRPCLDFERSAALSGPAMATTPSSIRGRARGWAWS